MTSPTEDAIISLAKSGLGPRAIATALGIPVGTAGAAISVAGLGKSWEERRAKSLEEQPARFRAKVDMSGGPDACWPWTAMRTPLGYGRVSFNMGEGRRSMLANRAAWFLEHGPIPAGAVIRHTCDNPPCCNPAHLIPGTRRDNTDDALERRRLLYGERHPDAKLSVAQAIEIKRLAGSGVLHREIAGKFGVHPAMVSQIHRGVRWARALEDHRQDVHQALERRA